MKLLKLKLDDLGKIGRGKSKHRPRDDKSLYGGEFPFVQTGDVKAANFYLTEFTQTYNEKGLAQSKLWKKGTLLITIAANIGDTAILGIDACFPDSIVGFQSYENVSDIKYVKYYLDYIKLELKAISAGTTQDNMSLEKLLSRNLYVHEYPNQVKIATILSSYDELIENNKQRIKLLEEMAEEIYKEWFVRLRFPGYENAKIVDGLPEGWVNGTIGDLVEFKKGKNITLNTVSEGNVPVVAGGLTPAYYHNVPNTISPTVTVSASGANAGFVNLYYEDIWASDCSFIDTKSTEILFFIYLTLKTRQNEVFFLQKGSAQPHVYPKDIMTLKMKKPSIDLIGKFEDLVVLFFEEIKILSQKINLLQETRDLLLPRLISGKLSVEHLVEEELLMAAEPRAEYSKS
jgi:type I restriction enzyme, S subunit